MKTKALISCPVTVQLICVFVFAYAKSWFSHTGSLDNSIYQMGSISRYDMYLHTLPLTQTDVNLKVLTHLKPPHRFCMLSFDVLPFTDDASVVNGKTSKKSISPFGEI